MGIFSCLYIYTKKSQCAFASCYIYRFTLHGNSIHTCPLQVSPSGKITLKIFTGRNRWMQTTLGIIWILYVSRTCNMWSPPAPLCSPPLSIYPRVRCITLFAPLLSPPPPLPSRIYLLAHVNMRNILLHDLFCAVCVHVRACACVRACVRACVDIGGWQSGL